MRILLAIFLGIALTACGGRSASPIQTTQSGDRQLSCNQIEAQIAQYRNTTADLDAEISARTPRNIGWGIAGAFLFPLWFGLDLGNAPETEKAAVNKRINQLARYGSAKDCTNIIY